MSVREHDVRFVQSVAALLMLVSPSKANEQPQIQRQELSCSKSQLELAYSVTVTHVSERTIQGGPLTLGATIDGREILRIEVVEVPVSNTSIGYAAPSGERVAPAVRFQLSQTAIAQIRALESEAERVREENRLPSDAPLGFSQGHANHEVRVHGEHQMDLPLLRLLTFQDSSGQAGFETWPLEIPSFSIATSKVAAWLECESAAE